MDKNKIIEAAAKLVAKGAYDKAIKEYQKVLETDPKDVRVLQKMGELYQKKNENPQAAHYFTKVAESYSQDGFFLKAVALYKQVLKLNPALVDVNLKLAELHQQLGLMSEAMAYFQLVANHHDQQGDTKASLDTLKKMVDLDPDNVASRIKLAELYAREGMSKEALGEFKRAAEYLKRNNRGDDYIRVADRISSLEPDNLSLAKELAQGFLQKGDQKRALAKLQICFKADPRDVETLTLLAQAFQGLGQTSKTISVYKELAKIHAEKGRSDEESQIWSRIRQMDPGDPDLVARSGPPASAAPAPAPVPSRQLTMPQPPTTPAGAVLAPPPPSGLQAVPTRPAQQAVPPPAPSPAPASAPPSGRDQLSKLLTETDVYVKYGLHDKALEHLRKVFSIDPENLDAHEKAYHIYVGSNNGAQASEQLLNVLRLCTRRSEVQRAQPYLQTILQQNPGHPEVPAFLAVLRTQDHRAPSGPSAPHPDEEAILVDSNEEEIIVAEAPEDALAAAEAEAEDDMAIRAASAAEEEEVVGDEGGALTEDTGPGEIRALEDEPLSGVGPAGELVMEDEEEPVTSSYSQDMVSRFREPSTLHDHTGARSLPEVEDDDAEPKTMLSQPLQAEELQAATTEPAFRRTPPTSTRPAVVVPEHRTQPELTQPNIRAPRPEPRTQAVRPAERGPPPQVRAAAIEGPTRIEAFPIRPEPARPPPSKAAPPKAEKPRPPARAPAPPPPPPAEEEVAVEECDEAAFFVDQGMFDEAREILETLLLAYPHHPRAKELLGRVEQEEGSGQVAPTDHSLPAMRPGSATAPAAKPDAFDLAAELADELGDEGGDSTDAGPPAGDDFQYSVEEVFSEFKKGLEKVVKPEDAETHYDLGIAYKEMGLLDDAIGEMAQARQGCAGKKKEIDCLLTMGILQAMKEDFSSAVGSFKEGLASEHAQGEAFKALAYELGTAYQALDEPGKALFWLQRIAKLDPKYREVSSLVQRLQASSARAEEDPLPVRRPSAGNGANGVHGGGGRGGPGTPPSGGASAPRANDASGKARKVGYV